MSDANKATLGRCLDEAFGKGNLAAVDELIADDFVDHSPPPNRSGDRAGEVGEASPPQGRFRRAEAPRRPLASLADQL